ncbi:hypothetical protein AX16_001256 [Volvariella volvacea WC 439]|nr:hypothetical protein AX16_001256 [Volvariella volvacea WC 439]
MGKLISLGRPFAVSTQPTQHHSFCLQHSCPLAEQYTHSRSRSCSQPAIIGGVPAHNVTSSVVRTCPFTEGLQSLRVHSHLLCLWTDNCELIPRSTGKLKPRRESSCRRQLA